MKCKACLLVGLMLLLMTLMVGGPAAAWEYTSTNPCLFDFKAATPGDSTIPYLNNQIGGTGADPYYSISCTRTDFETKMEHQNSGAAPGSQWRHIRTASDGLTIQSNALDNSTIGNWSYSKVTTWAAGAEPSITNLNWVRGIVIEVKAKSVGDMRTSERPAGYSWAGNYGRHGIAFSFKNNGMSVISQEPGLQLIWQTNDPTTQADDYLIVADPNQILTDRIKVAYPLGGDPSNPPEHVYRLETKRSPLRPESSGYVTDYPSIQLVNVYVDGERVIKNRTIHSQRQGDTGHQYVLLGAAGVLSNMSHIKGQNGDVFEYLKFYEGDEIVDVDPPNPVVNPSASWMTTQKCVRLSWTEPEPVGAEEIIGYKVERDGVILARPEWITTQYDDYAVTQNTT